MRGLPADEVRAQRIAESKAEGDRYRELSALTYRTVSPGWWVAESRDVERAVRRASTRVADDYPDFFEQKDLESEAWIIAARMAERIEEILESDADEVTLGTLQYEIEMNLIDYIRPIVNQGDLNSSGIELEALLVSD